MEIQRIFIAFHGFIKKVLYRIQQVVAKSQRVSLLFVKHSLHSWYSIERFSLVF